MLAILDLFCRKFSILTHQKCSLSELRENKHIMLKTSRSEISQRHSQHRQREREEGAEKVTEYKTLDFLAHSKFKSRILKRERERRALKMSPMGGGAGWWWVGERVRESERVSVSVRVGFRLVFELSNTDILTPGLSRCAGKWAATVYTLFLPCPCVHPRPYAPRFGSLLCHVLNVAYFALLLSFSTY